MLMNRLFVIENRNLWSVDIDSGKGTRLTESSWDEARTLVVLAQSLYAVQDSKLWCVNSDTGRATHLPESSWNGAVVLTSWGNWLFAIQDEKLWRVDPSSGKATHLPGATFSGTVRLAATTEWIYVIERTNLWQVDPESGRATHLTHSTWSDPTALIGLGKRLFAIEDEKLWKVDTHNGAATHLMQSSWSAHVVLSSLGNRLYAIDDKKLWRIQPETGQALHLTESSWDGSLLAAGDSSGDPLLEGIRTKKLVSDPDHQGTPDVYLFTRDDTFCTLKEGATYRAAGSPFIGAGHIDSTPDGCTWVPDFNFTDACNKHDLAYDRGGTEEDRKRADEALRDDITDAGHPWLAIIYYAGVRSFGRPHFNYVNASADGIADHDDVGTGTTVFTGDIHIDPDVPRTA